MILVIVCIVAATVVWHFSLISLSDHNVPIMVQSPATAPINTLTIGWTGDMVPTSNVGYDLSVLNNVTDTLERPDLMIGNLEGTLSHTSQAGTFQGDATFADTLKAAGFDFVSLINNHSLDYGTVGLKDTETELDRVGLAYISPDKPTTSITVKGVKIGIMAVSGTQSIASVTDYAYIANTVIQLKKQNDIVIVIFHGGAEGNDKTKVTGGEEYQGSEDRGNVQAVAHTAINAGADLVLGDGPHVLRKVETYHGKTIAYSLGNFVGGDSKLTTTNNLGLGGVFTATFENTDTQNSPQTTGFTSLVLSKDGTPSIDPTDKAKQLLDSLSNF